MGPSRFTPRETDVLRTLERGVSNTKEIARIVGMKEGTVKSHLMNMYKKEHVHSRASLLAKLLREERKEELPVQYSFQWRKG
jgi:DNA-binding CsgD family transcriptional regulator